MVNIRKDSPPSASSEPEAKRQRRQTAKRSPSPLPANAEIPDGGHAIHLLGSEARLISHNDNGAMVFLPRGLLETLRSLQPPEPSVPQTSRSERPATPPAQAPTVQTSPLSPRELHDFLRVALGLNQQQALLFGPPLERYDRETQKALASKICALIWGKETTLQQKSLAMRQFLAALSPPAQSLAKLVGYVQRTFPDDIPSYVKTKSAQLARLTDSELDEVHRAVIFLFNKMPQSYSAHFCDDLYVDVAIDIATRAVRMGPNDRLEYYIALAKCMNPLTALWSSLGRHGANLLFLFASQKGEDPSWEYKNAFAKSIALLNAKFQAVLDPGGQPRLFIPLASEGKEGYTAIGLITNRWMALHDNPKILAAVERLPFLLFSGRVSKMATNPSLRYDSIPELSLPAQWTILQKAECHQFAAAAVSTAGDNPALMQDVFATLRSESSASVVRKVQSACNKKSDVTAVALLACVAASYQTDKMLYAFLQQDGGQVALEKAAGPLYPSYKDALRGVSAALVAYVLQHSSLPGFGVLLDGAWRARIGQYLGEVSSATSARLPVVDARWKRTADVIQTLKAVTRASQDETKAAVRHILANREAASFVAEEHRKLELVLRKTQRNSPPGAASPNFESLRNLLQVLIGESKVNSADKNAIYSLLRSSVAALHPDKQDRLGPLTSEEGEHLRNLFLLANTTMQLLAALTDEQFASAMK